MEKKIYLKFSNPKSNTDFPKDGTIKKYFKKFIGSIFSILPKANPDFEKLIDEVEIWEIEYDLEENCAWREIGFNKNGQAILAMPFNNNYGYWTDNSLTLADFDKFDSNKISEEIFNSDWEIFTKEFSVLNKST